MKMIPVLIALAASMLGTALAQAPSAIERQILGHLKAIEANGTYGSHFDEDKLDRSNNALRQTLLKIGSRSDILHYGFPKLKDEMYIATSRDGRLRIYSWDLQSGGTMHDFANVFQFQGESGAVQAIAPKDDDESAGSFYTDIFQVDSKHGAIYLPVGTFIGSTSLNGQSIRTMRIDRERLVPDAALIRTATGLKNSIDFAYDFFTVVDRTERPVRLFQFNEKEQEFKFPVVIEDTDVPQGRVTNKFITYRFNGEHFIKVK